MPSSSIGHRARGRAHLGGCQLDAAPARLCWRPRRHSARKSSCASSVATRRCADTRISGHKESDAQSVMVIVYLLGAVPPLRPTFARTHAHVASRYEIRFGSNSSSGDAAGGRGAQQIARGRSQTRHLAATKDRLADARRAPPPPSLANCCPLERTCCARLSHLRTHATQSQGRPRTMRRYYSAMHTRERNELVACAYLTLHNSILGAMSCGRRRAPSAGATERRPASRIMIDLARARGPSARPS